MSTADHHTRTGLLCGIGAYSLWGVFPLYFRAVATVPPLTVLCHRVVWSALFVAAVISARREWRPMMQLAANRQKLPLLSLGAILIALNWLIFIYAVGTHQTIQASLGYFINPLLSVALGVVFLRERLRGWQYLAVALAVAAIVSLSLQGTGFPWIALALALTFGFYGLVRKKVDVNSLHGLLMESALLLPIAVASLFFLPRGSSDSPAMFGVLSLSGIITVIPLLMFGAALRRLELSTIGFLQYIGPTLQLLVAILLLNEHFDRGRLLGFSLCWAAIAVYVVDSVLNRRKPQLVEEPD